jgi:hypothetical protein
MTETKRLSLQGRLRMAAACPDANAALFAEAADAIEQHEAFKQEVSDALVIYSPENRNPALGRFIIPKPKPDPLLDIVEWLGGEWEPEEYVKEIRDALDARGWEIREKGK